MISVPTASSTQTLAARAAAEGDRLAYRHCVSDHFEETLTYAELWARSEHVATLLRACTRRGDRVVLAYPTGLEFIVALFACFSAGAVAVPLPVPQPNETLDRWVHVCDDARPALVLSDAAGASLLACRLQPAIATGRFGPVHAIIGHSFGAAASAIAIRRGLVVARLVLISCPYSLRHVVSGFARFAGVPSPSNEAMYPLMAALHRCPEQELSFEAIGPDLSVPTLIVHDEQDRYIPHTDGLKVHGLITRSEITVTSKLGHMRILQDDTVVTRATAFVAHVPGQAIVA